VSTRAGWTPTHVLVRDAAGKLLAAAPTYLKTHSQGEYVFDHGWADAYMRAGLDYYPKLQVAVPFTPATGRRLLVSADGGAAARATLIAGLRAWRAKTEASSIHVTFPTKDEWEAMGDDGFLQRTGQQFHFINKGYADFEAFLADLASRKRKMIRRERKDALANGIEIERVTGPGLTEKHWDAFFAFYIDTGSRKWGHPYLTRRFFSEVGASMADHILLVMAKRNGRYIAGALNFIGRDALYGRNWGAIEEHPFLHFEVCYYQAIEFAIGRGLFRVEAGAQGEHKLARGYGAVPTYSAHDIADRRCARAIDDYLARERLAIDEALGEYAEHAPFRKVPAGEGCA
jgi:predicted N-acyltransferase